MPFEPRDSTRKVNEQDTGARKLKTTSLVTGLLLHEIQMFKLSSIVKQSAPRQHSQPLISFVLDIGA